MYPEYANINGKEYKIDTDYRTALKCFELVNDTSIHDYERALAIVYLLFDVVPTTDDELSLFLKKATYFLECGKEQKKEKEPDMDFEQDAGYIMSSFMSDYHMNLNETKIHFWQYIELIEGLKPDCILNRVRDIRNFDLSKEKDAKKRQEIIEAKKSVALKKKKRNVTEKQKNIANNIFDIVGLKRK